MYRNLRILKKLVVPALLMFAFLSFPSTAKATGILDFFDHLPPPGFQLQDQWLGTSPEDYARLGLNPNEVEAWEDGLRTDPNSYSFEWWYSEANFADGSSVAVIFFTKPHLIPESPMMPVVNVVIGTPTGEKIEKLVFYNPAEASFSTNGCDLTVGPNHMEGNLQNYVIHADIEDVEVNLTLTNMAPSWRPATGHRFFGDADHYGGWLVPVPNGLMSGTLTYNGETHEVIGSGYHDHNWGVVNMIEHFNYWWWGRAQIGPYTVIAADQLMRKFYYGEKWEPIFVIMDQNGVLIDAADEGVTVTHQELNVGPHPDPAHGGEIAYQLLYNVSKDNGDTATLQFDAILPVASTNLIPLTGLTPEEQALLQTIGDNLKDRVWYTRLLSTAGLSFNIGGNSFASAGYGTYELNDVSIDVVKGMPRYFK